MKTALSIGSLLLTQIALSPSAFAIVKRVTFRGTYEKSAVPCTIIAAGEGEVWLKGTDFDWIWARRLGENDYRGTASRVKQTLTSDADEGKIITATVNGEQRITEYTLQYPNGESKVCKIGSRRR